MTFLFFILGASIGSFIGLVIDRFPKTSIITPASHCNSCQTRLKWYDLIPIFSQLVNLSRCRHCQTPISYRYACIEAVYGILVLLIFWKILTLSQGILLATSLCLSLFDIKSHSYPFVIWLLIFIPMSLFYHWQSVTVVLLLLGIFAEIKNIRMGSGDFFYLALLSVTLTFQEILGIIQIASLLGLLGFYKKKDRELAFIPYLSFAYLLILAISIWY